jgi:hypothetical protein
MGRYKKLLPDPKILASKILKKHRKRQLLYKQTMKWTTKP